MQQIAHNNYSQRRSVRTTTAVVIALIGAITMTVGISAGSAAAVDVQAVELISDEALDYEDCLDDPYAYWCEEPTTTTVAEQTTTTVAEQTTTTTVAEETTTTVAEETTTTIVDQNAPTTAVTTTTLSDVSGPTSSLATELPATGSGRSTNLALIGAVLLLLGGIMMLGTRRPVELK